MQASDVPLMTPISGAVANIFSDMLKELPALRTHAPVQVGNVVAESGGCGGIVMGPISSRLNSAGVAPVPGAAGGGGGSNNLGAPGTADGQRLATPGDAATTTVPSTAQSTAKTKPLSQQTARSAKGGGAAAAAAAAAEEIAAVSGTPRGALGTLDGTTAPGMEDEAVPADSPDHDPWIAAAGAVAKDEEAFLVETAPSLEWAKRRYAFFCDKDASSYLIEDVLGDWVEQEAPPPLTCTIDAVAMAREHTARLEMTYGYKVPRGLHEVGKVTPRAFEKAATLGQIASHEPGGATETPQFACTATVQNNLLLAASASAAAALGPKPPQNQPLAASARTLRQKTTAAVPSPSSQPASPQHKLTKMQTALQRPQLECSLKSIYLKATPHTSQSIEVELWNASSYSLRIKLAPSPWAPLSVAPAEAAKYDPERAIAPGCSLVVRVTFTPTESRAEPLHETSVSFGYTRELNEVHGSEQAFLTQQWNFLVVPVACVTSLPAPMFEPTEREGEEECNTSDNTAGSPTTSNPLVTRFGPIFATTRTTRTRTLKNNGARGVFSLETTDPDAFTVSPSVLDLASGASSVVSISFAPKHNGAYTSSLITRAYDSESNLASDDADHSKVVVTLTCELTGIGVVPRLMIEAVPDQSAAAAVARPDDDDADAFAAAVVPFRKIDGLDRDDAEHDIASANSSSSGTAAAVVVPPLLLFEDAAAHHASCRSFVLRNDSLLPLTYVWDTDAMTAGGGPACTMAVVPSSGVIPAKGRVGCQVHLTPQSEDMVTGLMSLYLLNMPTDPSPTAEGDAMRCGGWTSRQRLVPRLAAPQQSVAMADPFGLFSCEGLSAAEAAVATTAPSTSSLHHRSGGVGNNNINNEDSRTGCVVEVAQTSQNLFAAAIRLTADPKPLRVVVHPARIDNNIECLTQHENDRTFTITNHSPREVRFWLDPAADANHPGVLLAGGGGGLGTDASTATAATVAKRRKYERHMRELFGLSWVPNSQRQRDDCTLRFFPQSGVLPGNTTIEVHCKMVLHRLGHHEMEVECFIDALGRNESPMVTFVADAVGPSVQCSHQLLDFGVIAAGEESEARFTVTNHNPVKVAFRCLDPIPCDPPRFVFLPPAATLLAGKSIDITVYRQGVMIEDDASAAQTFIEVVVDEGGTNAIECRASIQQPAATVTPVTLNMGAMDAAIPCESEVFITNLSAIDIPFELRILDMPPTMSLLIPEGGVLFGGQYRASVKLKATFNGKTPDVAVVAMVSPKLPEPVLFEVTCAQVRTIAVALSTTSQRGDEPAVLQSLSLETFVSEVLWNLVTTHVLEDADVTPLFPHCPPIQVPFAIIADEDPFCAVQTRLRIDNKSGCNSVCLVMGSHFVPLMSPFRAPASSKKTDAIRVATPPNGGGDRGDGSTSSMSATRRSGAGGSQFGASHRSLGGGRHHHASSRGGTSSNGTSSVSQRIMRLKADVPSFECKAIDGRDGVEREQEALRMYAQSVLIDGRGCALQISNPTAPLKPHGSHEITATLIANLPGDYHETLVVSCDGVPPVALKMDMTVRGRPVLVDPTTSGLATSTIDGSLRLTLPSVVAGMNRARRRVRITSRCPRDLEVQAVLRSVTSSFSVAVGATEFDEVRLVGPDDDAAANRVASVTPSTLLLPALGSAELVIEFAPPATMEGGEWQAQLTIASRIAKTDFNDVFLMDEFYIKHADRFPADRAVTALGLGAVSGGAEKVRGAVSKLRVQLPLLDRPGVLKDNNVVYPTQTEQLVLELHRRQLRATPSFRAVRSGSLVVGGGGSGLVSPSSSAAGKAPPVAINPPPSMVAVVDSDDDEDDASNDVRSIGKLDGIDKEQLLAQDEERTELLGYLAHRREEVYRTLGANHLTPSTITVVGNIMPAKLACDPPEVLRFPLCRSGESSTRSIRLTNPTRTPLDFRVRVDGPYRVVRLDFIPADGEEDLLEEDDEEGRTARLATLKAGGAAGGTAAGKSTLGAIAGGKSLLMASGASTSTTLGGTRRTDPSSDPANTLFHLRPRDAVDLTVELNGLSTTSVLHKHQLEGSLTILFQGSTLTQIVPCLATVHTPSVTCDPEQTWFRPPVSIRDGRPQPKYPRTITLINNSNCDSKFTVRHIPRIDAPGGNRIGSAGGETIQRLKKVQAVLQVSPMEAHAELLDDASRFTIVPMTGVVPPATKGGAPGRVVLQVQFEEYSYLKYECRFRVEVEGGVGADFIVRGDSREVEI